jgi:hypothetical protein
MLVKLKTIIAAALLGSFSLSCLPQSDPISQIQPLPKELSEKQTQKKSEDKDSTATFTAGLPKTCQLTKGKPSCIFCISDRNQIKRCSKYISENFDPMIFCKHSKRNIKCFDANQGFALNINLATPLEKRFSRDLVMLAETLRLITDSRIADPELKSNISSLLDAVINHSTLFISEPLQIEGLIAMLSTSQTNLKKSHEIGNFKKLLLKLFSDIQKKRLLGQLEFQDSLNLIKSIMQSISDSQELKNIFEDLETTGMSADDFRLSTEP